MTQAGITMRPAAGGRLHRFVGDTVRFSIEPGASLTGRWQARLRTNAGSAELLRREILQAHTRGLPIAGASWRDLPMVADAQNRGWHIDLALTETGFFQAKPYLLDPQGWQHWPQGPNVGLSVHPSEYRAANTLYCAFARMFGATKSLPSTADPALDKTLKPLDAKGYTVIPPSGTLRDLTAALPHIMDSLGCRIIQLLPVNPTPTTGARFGRYGSPYAALDLTAIDPALVVFDKKSTGIDQFRDLAYAIHARGGRLFLDMVINHTGWGSTLQENHPEWFLRDANGTFVSPGAWGTIWEDLVELKHANVGLWDELARVFLTWCRRGVDGFRCDAGYKVPVAAWQYIIARVQTEYPDALFLLEGLGGAWEATEALLTEGGMQWAYSELFQNYTSAQVAGYLDHSAHQTGRVGLLVHFSETHDNERLAAKGRAWSLLRNRLCALASHNGGFAFTCGVEWLATEKLKVHGSSGMNWGTPESLVPELAQLNRLLCEHPCFFDGAEVTRLSPPESPVLLLRRRSAEGQNTALVAVNLDVAKGHTSTLPQATELEGVRSWVDLLGQASPRISQESGKLVLRLPAGGAYCLAKALKPEGPAGTEYRQARARAAWAISAMGRVWPTQAIGAAAGDWQTLERIVQASPAAFLAAISRTSTMNDTPAGHGLAGELVKEARQIEEHKFYRNVIRWSLQDVRRVTLVPPNHWLLVWDQTPFRATLDRCDGQPSANVESIPVASGHVACFPPGPAAPEAQLLLERYAADHRNVQAKIRFLDPEPPRFPARFLTAGPDGASLKPEDLALLTNGRGGMARLCLDLGRVNSKYDCALGANLHPELPVDRHVLVKRVRAWVTAEGFITPLDFQSLESFSPGQTACWNFAANAGAGRIVEIQMRARMLEGRNTTVLEFFRPSAARATRSQLPPQADVRLTVRLDIEDRGFHGETQHNGGADYHFNSHTQPVAAAQPQGGGALVGFEFRPAADRRLRVTANAGAYHPQPEWCHGIPHPVEKSRGQVGQGDAFSPGWFELPMPKGGQVTVIADAELEGVPPPAIAKSSYEAAAGEDVGFENWLLESSRAFVVRRGQGKTVIAGYPWFLDWGRDTFIAARGLIAAGLTEDVHQLVLTFARFEKDGTLPNTIFGEDASNRDTSDAPLWFGVVCEELATALGAENVYPVPVDSRGRTLLQVLESIATGYAQGTPNGIRMDPDSALIWSPSHFTWMDTNYPACTPREGYPVEIQALWVRLLRQLSRVAQPGTRWAGLASRAEAALEERFWCEDKGWYADVLAAPAGTGAAAAVRDSALRSNCLLLISLGLVSGERARRCVAAAINHLVVPGALRSLAPLPVDVPLRNERDGRLLNNPKEPYWGRYEGDEDTRRKPAYHNGTAWTWTFPSFCEALALAWENAPEAVAAARAYLGSMDRLMLQGCIGHLPEIVDGDAPHTQRGCDAQAWSATEALRVNKWLQALGPEGTAGA